MESTPKQLRSIPLSVSLITLVLVLVLAPPTSAIEWTSFEAGAHGYPEMRDITGRRMANGDFTQWIANDRLHVRIAYAFDGGRQVVEEVVFRQHPELAQESWSFTDLQG